MSRSRLDRCKGRTCHKATQSPGDQRRFLGTASSRSNHLQLVNSAEKGIVKSASFEESEHSTIMQALVYRNTTHTIPRWVPLHKKQPRGIAYETNTHFVHMFGKDRELWVISPGLTVTEEKIGTLRDWVERTFGAKDIEDSEVDVGHTIEGVWRPGLYSTDELLQGLSATNADLRLAEQSLLLLINRLDELLHFIEPSLHNLKVHSHKTRELLILSCTEVENYWKNSLKLANINISQSKTFTTNDYVKLKEPLFLDEFEVSLPRYSTIQPMRPFLNWKSAKPTGSLAWYDAYNKTKHDRSTHFAEATLWSCLQAVAANLVLFCVRFGPFHLFNGAGTLAAVFNQLFAIKLKDCRPTTFYTPSVALPTNQRNDLICFGANEIIQPRIVDPLSL